MITATSACQWVISNDAGRFIFWQYKEFVNRNEIWEGIYQYQ